MGNSFSCVRDNSERDYRAVYVPKSFNILTNGMQNEENSSKTGGAKDFLQNERKGNFSWISQCKLVVNIKNGLILTNTSMFAWNWCRLAGKIDNMHWQCRCPSGRLHHSNIHLTTQIKNFIVNNLVYSLPSNHLMALGPSFHHQRSILRVRKRAHK